MSGRVADRATPLGMNPREVTDRAHAPNEALVEVRAISPTPSEIRNLGRRPDPA